jgi:hypothetical protein
MNINGLTMLSKKITTSDDLGNEFRKLFSSSEANIKGVVYFFMSEIPIPRVSGESNILYIGKTKQTINKRYSQYSEKLASNRSGIFYKHIIENYGGIKMGYLLTDTPRETEREYFNKYCKTYLEFPPKSKIG